MEIVETFAEARRLRRGVTGLVPTLGFLHEGHLALMRRAGELADTVLVSVFVNPLQFGPGEDLERYPRDLERDASLAASVGVDVLFAPSRDEMYPTAPVARVTVDALAQRFEGSTRPGHFSGVATVVAKLLAGLQPDLAVFGRKDAQQLAVLRRMAADLSFPVEVIGAPTVRESDGLALSSRNVYLSPDERSAACALSRGLMAAADAVAGGETDGTALEAVAAAALDEERLVTAEYVALAGAADVGPLARLDRPAFLAVAARVGPARLIDNVHFDAVEDGTGVRFVADRGVRLDGPSLLYGDRPHAEE